jgi:hypothetical protein
MSYRTVAFVAALVWGFTGCGDDSLGPDGIVATVAVDPRLDTLQLGEAVRLGAVAVGKDGSVLPGRGIVWRTSDDGVATVDASGRVVGVAAGTVTITAVVEGKQGAAGIEVIGRPASVTVIPAFPSLPLGTTAAWRAEVRDPANHLLPEAVVLWRSLTPSVATVDELGQVTSIAPGTARIEARLDGITGSASANVGELPDPAGDWSMDELMYDGNYDYFCAAQGDIVLTGAGATTFDGSYARVGTCNGNDLSGPVQFTAVIGASTASFETDANGLHCTYTGVRVAVPGEQIQGQVACSGPDYPLGLAGHFTMTRK